MLSSTSVRTLSNPAVISSASASLRSAASFFAASSADFVATSAVSRADTVSREYRARAADRCVALEEALPRASADSDRVDAIDARKDDSTR